MCETTLSALHRAHFANKSVQSGTFSRKKHDGLVQRPVEDGARYDQMTFACPITSQYTSRLQAIKAQGMVCPVSLQHAYHLGHRACTTFSTKDMHVEELTLSEFCQHLPHAYDMHTS